jgi:potassium channel subfamily K
LKGNIIAFGLVLSYLIAGIIFYTQIENWSVLNCIYYSIVIVTTVGYGDVTPKTNDGKIFTIFYAFYGIVTIGMALGRLASAFLDRQKSIAKNASRKLLQNVDKAAVDTSGGKSHLPSSMPKKKKTYLKWVRLIFNKSNKAIVLAILPIFVSIGCGLIIGAIEGWPILDCFYYTIITITTIGFGDLSPSTTAGKIVAIFYLPLSVISVAHSIGAVMEEIGKRSVMKQKISMKELIAMDSDGDGQVSQMEYVCYMLVKLGKAEQEDIEEIIAQFRKLDKDGSGVLDKDDLERLDRQLQEQQAREMEEFT